MVKATAACIAAAATLTAAHVSPAFADDPTMTSYSLGVLVLKYFPLTSDGKNIDVNVTGDVDDSLTSIRTKTDTITTNVISSLEAGSSYHGYADPNATPALTYHVVDTQEIDTAVPTINLSSYDPNLYSFDSNYSVRPDYNSIMTDADICDYVDNQGVDEVWMYAYQGPSQLLIDESKMSGPNGDVSNSWVHNDLPVCDKTYTVYTYNYHVGTANAVHSHAHQIEYELRAVNHHLMWDLYENMDTPYLGGTSTTARCGSVHNPPNAQHENDWNDTTGQASDCMNWDPDGLGTTTSISCTTWGCSDISDTDNAQLNYIVWWMQNLPGRGNTVTYDGLPMRNWWDVHGDWDTIVSNGEDLTYTPTISCEVNYTKSEWAGGFSTTVTVSNTGTTTISGWSLTFDFPGDQQITSSWNSTYSQSGHSVTLTNDSSDHDIAASTSVFPGFQGTWSSSDADPSAFSLNGTACTTV